MPRNRIIYQNEGLFVGAAPASGYSFISQYGDLGNAGDWNLVFPLHRVQSVDYSANFKYADLQVLGKNAILTRPQIGGPELNLAFEYLQFGVLNELRMGFYSNYKIEYGARSGESYYPDNFNVFSLSGFIATDLNQAEVNDIHWPLQYRDRRNLYLALTKEGNDVNIPTGYDYLHPKAQQMTVAGFGNCYITNYTARASVGDFPRCSVSYIGENMKFYASGSGLQNPAIDSKSGNLVPNRIFQIPNLMSGSYAISVLRPGDITVDILSLPCLTGINAVDGTGYARTTYPQVNLFENVGPLFSDIKIQNYQLEVPLPRRDLKSIGYKYPLNRPPEFPLSYSFSMSAIVGDTQTGDWVQFMNQNDDYNLAIKINNPGGLQRSGIGVRYDLLRTKLQNISFRDKIGDIFKQVDFAFKGDIDPDDLSRGLFISGQLNTVTNTLETDFLLQETTGHDYVLQEDGISKIIIRRVEAPQF